MASNFSYRGWNGLTELKPGSPDAMRVVDILIGKIAEDESLCIDTRVVAALIAYAGEIISTSKFEELLEKIGVINDMVQAYKEVGRLFKTYDDTNSE